MIITSNAINFISDLEANAVFLLKLQLNKLRHVIKQIEPGLQKLSVCGGLVYSETGLKSAVGFRRESTFGNGQVGLHL